MTKDQVAKDVRVKIVKEMKPRSIAQQHLMTQEFFLYLRNKEIFNDTHGEYVWVYGSSDTNSGTFYLEELELELPVDHSLKGKFKTEETPFGFD